MKTMLNVLIFSSFFAFHGMLFPGSLALAQAEAPPQVITTAAQPAAIAQATPSQPQTAPWYKDPTVTGFVGIFGTFFAALLTAVIALLVRKLTNKHELRKMTLEKQLDVYGNLFEKIVQIDLIDSKDNPDILFKAMIDLLAEFERSYPFLDKRTIRVFNEQISIPFARQEFTDMFYEKGYDATYQEIRHRLTGKVLPTAKGFLDQFK